MLVLFFLINISYQSLYCEITENFLNLVHSYDYFQERTIQTEDDYFLRVFRFGTGKQDGEPILLIHGILDSGDDFVLNNNPGANLAHLLVQKNYDIWVLNVRGNKYSCLNKKFDGESKEFWDFSFHEIGIYDIPAVVNEIFQDTQKKVTIMAHSQGTSASFVALSLKPEIQDKLQKVIMLAPIAYFKGLDQKDTIYFFLASQHFIEILKFFGIRKIFEEKFNRSYLESFALNIFCNSYFNLCDFLIQHFTDKDSILIDKDQINRFLQYLPARASTKGFEHFSQLMEHKDDVKFTYFDYGEKENQKRYNQKTPPIYDLTKIEIPIVLYYGDNDLLSTEDNNILLSKQLKNVKLRKLKDYGHLTYFWSTTLELLDQYLQEDLRLDLI